jgi:hypothetical protein
LIGVASVFDWNRPFRPLMICLVLILLFSGLPVIAVIVSSAIANTLGCTLNEGDIHPCLFHGFDLGGLLYDLFVSGWFGLLTIPLGGFLLAAWIVTVVVLMIKRRRARG